MSLAALESVGITFDSISALMTGHDGGCWVAVVEEDVVAFSMAKANECTIFAMFVRPAFEGRGLGRALMAQAESWLFERGCGEIWLLTDANPAVRANGFYRHLGWTDTGIQPDGQVKFVKKPTHASSSIDD